MDYFSILPDEFTVINSMTEAMLALNTTKKYILCDDISPSLRGDSGCAQIAKVLGNNTACIALILEKCGVSSDTMNELSLTFQKNSTLKHLSIARNISLFESQKCFRNFFSSLKQNVVLESLDISRCNLDEYAAREIGTYIASDSVMLKYLDISYNKIGDEGGLALRTGMEKNKHLMKLIVEETGIGLEYSNPILASCKRNQQSRERRLLLLVERCNQVQVVDYTQKRINIVGETSVGKTALVHSLLGHLETQRFKPTTGMNIYSCFAHLENKCVKAPLLKKKTKEQSFRHTFWYTLSEALHENFEEREGRRISKGQVLEYGRQLFDEEELLEDSSRFSRTIIPEGACTLTTEMCEEANIQKRLGSLPVQVYDFSGKECYRQLHPLLLGQDSINIFVFSQVTLLDDIEKLKKDMKTWLALLKNETSRPKVILVGTHSDLLIRHVKMNGGPRAVIEAYKSKESKRSLFSQVEEPEGKKSSLFNLPEPEIPVKTMKRRKKSLFESFPRPLGLTSKRFRNDSLRRSTKKTIASRFSKYKAKNQNSPADSWKIGIITGAHSNRFRNKRLNKKKRSKRNLSFGSVAASIGSEVPNRVETKQSRISQFRQTTQTRVKTRVDKISEALSDILNAVIEKEPLFGEFDLIVPQIGTTCFFSVDNLHREGLERLSTALRNTLAEDNDFPEVSQKWLYLYDICMESLKGRIYLPYSEILELSREAGLQNQTEVLSWLSFFAVNGLLLNFSQELQLRDIIIFDIAEAFRLSGLMLNEKQLGSLKSTRFRKAGLLDHFEEARSRGIASFDLIEEIWGKENTSAVLHLLEAVQLTTRISFTAHDHKFIFPTLLLNTESRIDKLVRKTLRRPDSQFTETIEGLFTNYALCLFNFEHNNLGLPFCFLQKVVCLYVQYCQESGKQHNKLFLNRKNIYIGSSSSRLPELSGTPFYLVIGERDTIRLYVDKTSTSAVKTMKALRSIVTKICAESGRPSNSFTIKFPVLRGSYQGNKHEVKRVLMSFNDASDIALPPWFSPASAFEQNKRVLKQQSYASKSKNFDLEGLLSE
eukprot:maker-scaffold_32-snap-gene-3.38-mRNA-1 protein AED:0.35 eAED:0.35 QI:39/1/0.5/1/1/1/2/0/1051